MKLPHLNLHDPKTRQRVLLAGAAFGLVVAILYRRAKGTAPAVSTVGATVDPSALDPNAFTATSGLAPALGGSGASGVTPSDTATDTASAFDPFVSALTDAVSTITDAAATIAGATPAPTLDPSQFTTAQLAVLGSAKAGPSPFTAEQTTALAHEFGSMTPAQLQALGVGAAPAPTPTMRTLAAASSAPVNVPKTSGIATPTPAPAPVFTPTPAAPVATMPGRILPGKAYAL